MPRAVSCGRGRRPQQQRKAGLIVQTLTTLPPMPLVTSSMSFDLSQLHLPINPKGTMPLPTCALYLDSQQHGARPAISNLAEPRLVSLAAPWPGSRTHCTFGPWSVASSPRSSTRPRYSFRCGCSRQHRGGVFSLSPRHMRQHMLRCFPEQKGDIFGSVGEMFPFSMPAAAEEPEVCLSRG